MARLGTRSQLLLLASAAGVPISLGLAAWPPALPVHEIVVVHAPVRVVDLEGDGQWELLVSAGPYFSEPQLLAFGPEGLTALTTLPSVPSFGCPC